LFLAGSDFTMADITAFAGLAYAAIAKIEVPGELTNLKFWHQRVASRPSIAQA
jgi:glutathione S-transferase